MAKILLSLNHLLGSHHAFGLLSAFAILYSVPSCCSAFVTDPIISVTSTRPRFSPACGSGRNLLSRAAVRGLPQEEESWFVKTEQFCQPFPFVKPHLEAHRAWVAKLRSEGHCVTSGYRVDGDGKPGGGGMMFFAATSYEAAEELVRQDPLVANGCVDWALHGWVSEVGDVQLR